MDEEEQPEKNKVPSVWIYLLQKALSLNDLYFQKNEGFHRAIIFCVYSYDVQFGFEEKTGISLEAFEQMSSFAATLWTV